jgi:hypothetical protein
MHVIKGGTHNDSWMVGGSEYFEKMRSFLSHIMLNESDHNFQGNDSIGSLDCPGRESTDSDSVEVTMGQSSMNAERNSIPIMPKNFLGIAKEATKLNKKESVVGPDKKRS